MLTQAEAGAGSLMMLGGEPGVGKTRLVREVLGEAVQRGFFAGVGHCYDLEGAPPYSPWVEILEGVARVVPGDTLRDLMADGAPELARLLPELRLLYPDLPPPLDLPTEQARSYLFRCFRELLERASRMQPVLLVLEDLHWGDEATLLLVRDLAPHLFRLPVVVLGTYRDTETDAAPPLADALRHLVRERLVDRVAVKRLPKSGVASLLEALGSKRPPTELVESIFSETEGNPFFVEEVYLHLEEQGRLFGADGEWRRDLSGPGLDIPEGVRLAIDRRLEPLQEEARAVLATAAVVGRRFSFDLLEKTCSGEAASFLDTVEEAERLSLIELESSAGGREVRYRFCHELIRQTLLSDLSVPRRRLLHLRVADAMEEMGSSDLGRHASALAHHFWEAGAGDERTVRYLVTAAGRALEAGPTRRRNGVAIERCLSSHPETSPGGATCCGSEARRGEAWGAGGRLSRTGGSHWSFGSTRAMSRSWPGTAPT